MKIKQWLSALKDSLTLQIKVILQKEVDGGAYRMLWGLRIFNSTEIKNCTIDFRGLSTIFFCSGENTILAIKDSNLVVDDPDTLHEEMERYGKGNIKL